MTEALTMRLAALAGSDLYIPPEWDREFLHVVTDSRDIAPGDLFIARGGSRDSGSRFIDAALAAGAVAILEEGESGFRCEAGGVPVFTAPEVRTHLSRWLLRRYENALKLPIVAVTGTNGKSSTVQYVAQLLTALGYACGVIGTTGNGIWPTLSPTRNTTPDLSVTLRQLELMQQQGAALVAMEVSSHGIDQGRIAGLSFAAAGLTNVTRDHLDYHGDMDSYFAAKQRLFTESPLKFAVLNLDDPLIAGWAAEAGRHVSVFGMSATESATVCYELLERQPGSMRARLQSPWGEAQIELSLMGDFNLANAVMAISLLACCGYPLTDLCRAAAALNPVDGRMELYRRPDSPAVIVDFAHTPDAIRGVLESLQAWNCPLTLVYGCGGERDRSKRPLMTEAALAADRIWLTSDNPRGEDPLQIRDDALAVAGSERICYQPDRRQAILDAIAASGPSAMVVVAGKGHENYQEVQGIKHPYSDAAVLLEAGYQRAGGEHVV